MPYNALSYTWGSPQFTDTIYINGHRISVTSNLFEAILALRKPDEDVTLWVDFLCIDQSNNDERSHQVRHMASIYEKAERVVVWLGRLSDPIQSALLHIHCFWERASSLGCATWSIRDPRWAAIWFGLWPLQYGSPEDYVDKQEWLSLAVQNERVLEGMTELLARPWFTRVWILQGTSGHYVCYYQACLIDRLRDSFRKACDCRVWQYTRTCQRIRNCSWPLQDVCEHAYPGRPGCLPWPDKEILMVEFISLIRSPCQEIPQLQGKRRTGQNLRPLKLVLARTRS